MTRYKVSLIGRVRDTFDHLRRTVQEADDTEIADPYPEVGSLSLGADGELTGAISCAYCGMLNRLGTDVCNQCGEYIADQGPDLQARLRRISRHANRSPGKAENDPHEDDRDVRNAVLLVLVILLFVVPFLIALTLFLLNR